MNIEILEALTVLRTKYPRESRLALWTDYYADQGCYRFTAIIGEAPDAEYGHGDTPAKAVEDVLKKAGERGPNARLIARIEKKRREISELEAKLSPPCAEPEKDEAPTFDVSSRWDGGVHNRPATEHEVL